MQQYGEWRAYTTRARWTHLRPKHDLLPAKGVCVKGTALRWGLLRLPALRVASGQGRGCPYLGNVVACGVFRGECRGGGARLDAFVLKVRHGRDER